MMLSIVTCETQAACNAFAAESAQILEGAVVATLIILIALNVMRVLVRSRSR